MNETATGLDRWTAASCRFFGCLFSVCGAAGAAGGEPEMALLLTSLAGQYAWHVELFFDLLPVRVGIDRDGLVDAATVPALSALERLAPPQLPSVVGATLRLVVLPRLEADLSSANALVDARLDGPRARALTLVRRDLLDALDALASPVNAALAADDGVPTACVDLEDGLVSAGVTTGLLGVPDIGWGG